MLAVVLLLVSLPSIAQSDGRDVFQEAEVRFRNGDYELALDRYRALVRDYPFSSHVPDAQFRIGMVQNRLGRYEDALSTFRRVETRFRSTQFIDLLPFWMGMTRYYLSDFDAAIGDLNRFLDGDPQDSVARQALLYRALSRDRTGEDPREDVERVLELAESPVDEPYATAILMRSLMRSGLAGETIDLYESFDASELDEGWRERIELYAAEAYRSQGNIERAMTLYRGLEDASADVAVIAFQRQFEWATGEDDRGEVDRIVRQAEVNLRGRTDVLASFWQRIGVNSFLAGSFDLAELYLSRVWDLRDRQEVPGLVPMYLAEVHVERGDPARAQGILEDALEQSDDETERIMVRLGGIHIKQQEYEAAAERLAAATEQFPEGAFTGQAAYQRAFALFQIDRLEEAIAVIRDANERGVTGGFSREMRRLRASAHRGLGELDESIDHYRSYLAETPDDSATRLEYTKVLFLAERYEQVNEQVSELYDRAPDLRERDPSAFLQAEYLEGLARVARRQYEQAVAALESLRDFEFVSGSDGSDGEGSGGGAVDELSTIYPHGLYYLGWSYYRLGEWEAATGILSEVVAFDHGHERAPRSAYIAGWSAFSGGDYEGAREMLERLKDLDADDALLVEGRYLLAQVHRELNDFDDAAEEFAAIYEDFPDSGYAAEALYEHASLMADQENTDEAAELYGQVFERFPDRDIGVEALYRRGEVYFSAGEYEAARDAWLTYRGEAEGDRLFAASLYWSGAASLELEETGAALLVWNRLIDEFPDSSFRFDAMAGAAEIYEQRGDLRQALNLYTEMAGRYEERAAEIEAQERIDELVLRIGGLGEREASLLVRIEQGQRAGSSDGREAILELARLVIYEGVTDSPNRRLVLPLLREVTGREDEDPERAARAQFLIGEWYHQQDENSDAAEAFLEAAGMYRADEDLSAQSLYRAANSYRRSGRSEEVIREIVETMRDEFPGSEWTAEAERILEAL